MNQIKKATMKDIALETGFSVNTVARALKNRDDVAQESKKRILDAAKRMNYINNSAATFLRTGHSGTIAVIVSDITNPTFSAGVREIEEYASERGYATLIFNTNEDEKSERVAIQSAISKNADGILICPCKDSKDNLSFLNDTKIPFILLGRKADARYKWVVKDDMKCGRLVAERLIKYGNCKRILMINGCDEISSACERKAGFFDVIKKSGLSQPIELTFTSDIKTGSVAEIIDKVLKDGIAFDGIFAFSDILAMEAINETRNRMKGDAFTVSVAGIDNLSRFFSYLQPIDSAGEIGESLHLVSVKKLIDILDGNDKSPDHIVLDVKLYVRGSVN